MNKYTIKSIIASHKAFRNAQSRFYAYNGSTAGNFYLKRKVETARQEFIAPLDKLSAMWESRLGSTVNRRVALMFSLMASDIPLFGDYDLNRAMEDMSAGMFGRFSSSLGDEFFDWVRETGDKCDSHPHFPFDAGDCDLVETAENEYIPEGDSWYCDSCDAYHHDDVDTIECTTRIFTQYRFDSVTVCENTDTFYCNASDRHYDSHRFSQDNDEHGETVCAEWCTEAGWYYDDGNDCWSEYPPSNRIPDYHDGDRCEINRVIRDMRTTPLVDRKERRYGIEMEVEFPDSSDRSAFYAKYEGGSACIERDGSLSDSRGLEIISPPIKLSEHREGTWYSEMLQSARSDFGATAWRHRASYGCHVNVDLREVTDGQVALFVALVNNMASLYSMVSGRKRVYNGEYKAIDRFDPTANKAYYGVDGHIDLTDKYQPVRVANLSSPSSRFAEVRTFGANLRPNAMLEYIELVDATLCYAQYLSTLPYQLDLFDAIPITAYPVAEAFNQSVVGFLRWLPTEYTAFRKFLAHNNVPMDETADQFIADKVASL
jgi:hypothetical protein